MALAPVLDLRPQAEASRIAASVEAEQSLLGAALYDAEAFHAAPSLQPPQFYEPLHGRVWAAIGDLIAAGRQPDPLLVLDRLGTDPALVELGGIRYLADLVDRAPPASRAAGYADLISDHAARRGLIRVGGEIAARAAETGDASALDILTDAESALAEIASAGVTRSEWATAGDVVAGALESAQARGGVTYSTGVAEIDAMTGGLTEGEMAVLAGRPGMAKSTGGLTIARANAAAGLGTLLFSLEMAAEPVGLRLACDVAYDPGAVSFQGRGENPTFDRARRNALDPGQWQRLRDAAVTLNRWPLLVDCRPGLTVAQMEACARRAYREWERRGIPRGPIIVDHLGIVRPDKARAGNKVVETGDVSRGLAEMAKRLNVPVVALVQVNRANEGRDDKRPGLADLRWSGAIEEDARLAIFLHRPAYYLRSPEDSGAESLAQRNEREVKLAEVRNKLFWIIAKQNNGPTGQVETFCEIGCSVIRDRREFGR